MRIKNKFLRSYLVLIKENKMEIRLFFKGKVNDL